MVTEKIDAKPVLRRIEPKGRPLDNQDGSVIVIVLMVLVTMTVIGIMSSDSLVSENYIVRNVGIHQQNVDLVESALMQGLQRFMQIDDSNPANFNVNASPTDWLNYRLNTNPADNEYLINTIWYQNNFTQRCLNAKNSLVANILPLLTTRGENGNGNLRFAIVGWAPVGNQSVTVGAGAPVWHQGRIIAEYVSTDAAGNDNGYGLIRMEIGVKRKW
jgi:Tfp pilus assembly protein PilX